MPVGCGGVLRSASRMTALKTRIVALRQQMVRVDRERREPITPRQTEQLLKRVERHLTSKVSAVILCDYGKGVVTQELLDSLTVMCRQRGIWLSMDPKPVKPLHLKGLSLMTPNRKELFALARRPEVPGTVDPLKDRALHEVIAQLMTEAAPAYAVTLGERGMAPRTEPFIPHGSKSTMSLGRRHTYRLHLLLGEPVVEAAIPLLGVVVGKAGPLTVYRTANSVRDHG